MPWEILGNLAEKFGFQAVFVTLVACGLAWFIVHISKAHRNERSEWRKEAQDMRNEHKDERSDWQKAQTKQADKVVQSIESLTHALYINKRMDSNK